MTIITSNYFLTSHRVKEATLARSFAMKSAQRKLRNLLDTLSCEPRERLLQMAGLGAHRVDKLVKKRDEVGRSFGVQDVLRIPRMGPRVAANLVEDPLLPTVVNYVLYYQEMVGSQWSRCTSQEVGGLLASFSLATSGGGGHY